MTNKNQSINIYDIFQFEEIMDKLFHKRSNIDAYEAILMLTKQYWCFLGTPRIFTIISIFYVTNPCKQWQIKINQHSGHFSGCHINIVAFFAEHLEVWEYKRFTRGVWVTSDKVKSTIKNQDTLHIENKKYRVLHKEKNIDASLAEHPKFKNK